MESMHKHSMIFLASSVLVFLLCIATAHERVCAQEASLGEGIDEYFKNQNEDLQKELESAQQAPCTAQDVVDTLVNSGVVNLLKVPIYKRTNSILNRSIHDLPTFNWVDIHRGCFDLSVLPFYNQTSKLFFTRSDPFIRSYINLTGQDFIDAVEEVAELLRPEEASPIGEILPLFEHIKLQERRAGLYFRVGGHNNNWDVKFSLPLYYLERNFFLTPEEIEAISFSTAIRELSEGSSRSESEELLTEHLVSDKLGLGDLRIHALYAPWTTESTCWSLGGFITLPTAFAFQQGIIGGSFCKVRAIPPFDIQQIICGILGDSVAQQIQSFDTLTKLAFAVLDTLTANVADTSLGNNGHFTFAPLAQYEHFFNSCWGIRSQASIQYVAPAHERRFFIKRINPESFERDFTNPDLAEDNLAFIQQKIIDTLFPSVFSVKVRPGAIANANVALLCNYNCFEGWAGYDFYWQGEEKLELSQRIRNIFRTDVALNSRGIQHKFFGGIEFNIPYSCGLLYLGLRGDITFSSRGLGKDFTLAFNLAFSY